MQDDRWRTTLETVNRSLAIGLAPAEARALQQRSLARALAHAAAASPFHRARLSPLLARSGFDMARWRDVPILTKEELRAHRDAIAVTQVNRESGPVRDGWTSGSEGEPLHYLRTALADAVSSKVTQRFMRWWKMDGNLRLAQVIATRQTTDEAAAPVMRRGWLAGHPAGEFHTHPVSADLQVHIAWLQKIQPAYFKTYPEVLAELARMCLRQGRRIPMRLIVSGGGVLTEDIRKLCRDAFGCAVADYYGAEEVGGIAAQCPRCGAYHAADENLLLEIVRADGTPAGPGETGRVLVTTLFNDAFPLVRYEVGDQALAGAATACRQPLVTLTRILGRSKAVFRLPGGRTVWPFIPSGEMGRLPNLRRFQFVQVAEDEVELHYIPHDATAGTDESLAGELVRQFIDPALRLRAVPVQRIARDDGFKYMLYRSAIPA